MTPIVDWEKKSETYYKFVNMNAIVLQNTIPTLEICSKSCDYFDPLFIKQIKKWPNVDTLLEAYEIVKNTSPLCS